MKLAEQRAEQLDALAKFRDLTAMAITMPSLAEPDRPELVTALEAARILGVEKAALCHPLTHDGCPLGSMRYSGAPSPHPKALA
ncbi:hypothetical protein ACRAWG_05785 [Methylobacterium sp. P31]